MGATRRNRAHEQTDGKLYALRASVLPVIASTAMLTAPYMAVATAGAAAWAGAAGTAQLAAGLVLRVSAATPVLSTACGVSSIAASSVSSGAAGAAVVAEAGRSGDGRKAIRKYLERTDELIADVVLGFMGFALVGGRLRELLPSDLRYPGAMARESLRAPGQAYANDTTRRELGILFKRYGCHTCGTRTGEFVGDHMPPNKVVHGSSSSRGGGGGIFRRGVVGMYQRAIYGGFSKGARQRYYPQCRPCSQLQAAAVQNNVKRLRLHAGFVGPTLVVGAMVALRHFGGADAKVQKRVRQWWNDGVKRLSSNSDSLDALILSVRE